MILTVRVTPNAKETSILGWEEQILRIRLAAPPIEGRANEALLRFLSKKLRVPFTELSLHTGSKGRLKRVSLPDGIDLKNTLS